jgi:hypothetical protein
MFRRKNTTKVVLLIWLAFSVEADDELYGIRYSRNNLEQSKEIVN